MKPPWKKNVETYNIKINIEKITFPNWTMNEIIAYQSLPYNFL